MKMKKRIYLSILIAAVFSFAAEAQIKAGNDAPDFTMTLSTGETVQLSSYAAKGEAVLLHFWATWCPPCRAELPGIDALEKRLEKSHSSLKVLCVCVGDEEKSRAAFMKKNGYTFTGGLDADGTAASLYGVSGIPMSVIIGKDGKVQKVHLGRMSEEELKRFAAGYE